MRLHGDPLELSKIQNYQTTKCNDTQAESQQSNYDVMEHIPINLNNTQYDCNPNSRTANC